MNEKSRILFKVAEIRFEKWKGGRGLKFFPPPQRSGEMTPLYMFHLRLRIIEEYNWL